MQLFLTSNKKRIQKDFVLILFIYSTLNITKKGKGGKKKKTLCSSMPEICHHIRRSIDDMKKTWRTHRNQRERMYDLISSS